MIISDCVGGGPVKESKVYTPARSGKPANPWQLFARIADHRSNSPSAVGYKSLSWSHPPFWPSASTSHRLRELPGTLFNRHSTVNSPSCQQSPGWPFFATPDLPTASDMGYCKIHSSQGLLFRPNGSSIPPPTELQATVDCMVSSARVGSRSLPEHDRRQTRTELRKSRP